MDGGYLETTCRTQYHFNTNYSSDLTSEKIYHGIMAYVNSLLYATIRVFKAMKGRHNYGNLPLKLRRHVIYNNFSIYM